jgi:hypothetical protein
MAIALHHSRATGSAKLVLLGIANHDGDGGAWPSVATLARYAAVTPRNAQKAIDRLVELREIVRELNAGGTASTSNYTRPNLYRFVLSCPPTCDHTSRHMTKRQLVIEELPDPLSAATGGVASDRDSLSAATPEPSYNHPSITQVLEPATDVRAKGVARCTRNPSGAHDFTHSTYCANACGARDTDLVGA